MLRIPIPLQWNTASSELSLKQGIFSSAYKAVNSFLIILLVTNQSGISYNDARESSTTSSHIFELDIYQDSIQLKKGSSQTTLSTILQVLYLSGQYTTKEEPLEATVSHISWVLYW